MWNFEIKKNSFEVEDIIQFNSGRYPCDPESLAFNPVLKNVQTPEFGHYQYDSVLSEKLRKII